MKFNSRAILGLMVLAGCLTAASVRAEDAVQSCEVPDYLLSTESALPKVMEAVKGGHPLDILVIGSRSSTIPSAPWESKTSTWPPAASAASTRIPTGAIPSNSFSPARKWPTR